MREPVEADLKAGFSPRLRGGSRGLHLVRPWTLDEAAVGWGGRNWADPSAWTSDRSHLAILRVVEQELARPSAMVVMRQLLDAWRTAERQLDAAFDGSLEWRDLQTQVATFRALYQGLFASVRLAQVERAGTGGW